MATTDDDYEDDDIPASTPWTVRVKNIFWPPATLRASDADEAEILPANMRKAAMTGLDGREVRFATIAFVLGIVFGIVLPTYFIIEHVTQKAGKHHVTVGPDALLIGGAILLFCALGLLALWRRRRTLVAFFLLLCGFAVAYPQLLVGMLFIVLAGWLMLNAWRINRYGTNNAKAIRQEIASRPRGKAAASSSKSAGAAKGKAATQPGVRKPPTASKRYTPKAPPRKKIPKPTQ